MNLVPLLLVAAAGLPLRGLDGSESDGPPSEMKADELKAGISRVLNSITSVRLVYSIAHTGDVQNPTSPGPHLTVRREMILRRPHFGYFSMAHADNVVAFDDDPFAVQWFVNADELVSVRPFERTFGKRRLNKSLTLNIDPGHYVRSTGMWILPQSPDVDGFPTLNDIVQDAAWSVVNARQVKVAGVYCHVLKKQDGLERLLIDTSRWVVIRREKMTPEGHLYSRFDFDDFVDCGNGSWFPKSVRSWRFDAFADSPETRGRVVKDTTLTVSTIAVNSDDAGVVAFVPSPGSCERASDGSWRQVTDGGTELFDNYVRWCQAHLGIQPHSGGRSQRTVLTIAFLSSLVVGLVIADIVRRIHHWRDRVAMSKG